MSISKSFFKHLTVAWCEPKKKIVSSTSPGPGRAQRALVAANNEFLDGASKYNKPNEPTIMFLTFQT